MLSTAVHKAENPEEFARRYWGLLYHYGIKPHATNAESPNKNGDVESLHRNFKRALDKEIRYDFDADGFFLDSFFGTEAALRLAAFLYDLVALFKITIIGSLGPTLRNIRYQIIVAGAQPGSSGRRKILRISASDALRAYLETLLERVSHLGEG